MCLHTLFGGETHERGGEDDAHGDPVAPEQPAERGVGQPHGQQDEDWVYARFCSQLVVATPDFGEWKPFVQRIPAQGAQVGVALEADRQRRDLHYAGDGLAALFVVGGDDRAFLETRQLEVDPLRGSDTLRVADHARGVHARSEQVSRIFRNEVEDFRQLLSGLHNEGKNSPFRANRHCWGRKNYTVMPVRSPCRVSRVSGSLPGAPLKYLRPAPEQLRDVLHGAVRSDPVKALVGRRRRQRPQLLDPASAARRRPARRSRAVRRPRP